MGDPTNAVRAFSRAGLSAGKRQSGIAPSKHVMIPCISKWLSCSCTALHRSLSLQHTCGWKMRYELQQICNTTSASSAGESIGSLASGYAQLLALQVCTAQQLWSCFSRGWARAQSRALSRCARIYHEILQHTLGPQVAYRCMLWQGLPACSL